VGHQGPLLWHDKDYNGSRFNVLVEWENGEITTEPLLVIAADDPVACAGENMTFLMSKDGDVSGTLLSEETFFTSR
jgi:hypothetical protein